MRSIRLPVFECDRMPLSVVVHRINDLAQQHRGTNLAPRIYLNLRDLKPVRARAVANEPITLKLQNVDLNRLLSFLCNRFVGLYYVGPGIVEIRYDAEPGDVERKSHRPAWKP